MARKMEFKTAKRDQVYIKAVITGPSGSGKSYSALRVATGIAERIRYSKHWILLLPKCSGIQVKESFYEAKKIQMVADPIGSSRLSDGGEFGLRRIEKK